MNIYILAQMVFISGFTYSLGAQTFNKVAPPFNPMTESVQSTSLTSRQAHDQTITDTLSENVRLYYLSSYQALDHSPVLKVNTRDGQRYTGSKKGISFWDGYSSLLFSTDNSDIPENNVTALAVDDRNNLWIGTKSKGIVIAFGKPFKPYKTKIIPTHDPDIYSVVPDQYGDIWVTFQDGGFEYFKDGVSYFYFPGPD